MARCPFVTMMDVFICISSERSEIPGVKCAKTFTSLCFISHLFVQSVRVRNDAVIVLSCLSSYVWLLCVKLVRTDHWFCRTRLQRGTLLHKKQDNVFYRAAADGSILTVCFFLSPNTSLASECTFLSALNGPSMFHLYRSSSPWNLHHQTERKGLYNAETLCFACHSLNLTRSYLLLVFSLFWFTSFIKINKYRAWKEAAYLQTL